jgi:formylglycine-generating enzyme required for sulfatase activity
MVLTGCADIAHRGIGAAPSQESLRDCPNCPQLIEVPARVPSCPDGPSVPESPWDKPAYFIGTYEVTFDEWDACSADGGCRAVQDQGWGRGGRPVINVDWTDAARYLTWLSKRTGHTYRLPTEVEWERAARAGHCTAYSFGDDEAQLCLYGNGADLSGLDAGLKRVNEACRDGFGIGTAPVGSFGPNALGLHDMHGNVWEWTAASDDLPIGQCSAFSDTSAAPRRIARGGSWGLGPSLLRSDARIEISACMKGFHLGFRVARDANP